MRSFVLCICLVTMSTNGNEMERSKGESFKKVEHNYSSFLSFSLFLERPGVLCCKLRPPRTTLHLRYIGLLFLRANDFGFFLCSYPVPIYLSLFLHCSYLVPTLFLPYSFLLVSVPTIFLSTYLCSYPISFYLSPFLANSFLLNLSDDHSIV